MCTAKHLNIFPYVFCKQWLSLKNVLNTWTAVNILNIKGQPVVFCVLLARSTSAGISLTTGTVLPLLCYFFPMLSFPWTSLVFIQYICLREGNFSSMAFTCPCLIAQFWPLEPKSDGLCSLTLDNFCYLLKDSMDK